LLGKGCGSWLILNFGKVKCAFFVLVSDVLVVDGVDCLGLRILVHEVDPWPVGLSLGVSARFVFFEPFPAFFLSMPLKFAKVAEFAVPVGVVPATQGPSSFWSRS
jgi:hypothetical protein